MISRLQIFYHCCSIPLCFVNLTSVSEAKNITGQISNQSIMYMDKKNAKRGSYVKIVDPIVIESSFITLINTYSLIRKLSTKTAILED